MHFASNNYRRLWTGWGRKRLVDFIAGKTLVSFDQSNNTGAIDVKMDGLTFSSKLDWGSYIISIAKTTSKEIGALFYELSFS